MRLNLGCGEKVRPGWINVDAQDFGQEIVSDLRRLPLDDEVAVTADAIHVIEHFDAWEGPALLKEWHRVLKPAGVLRVEFPEWAKVMGIIKTCDTYSKEARHFLYGALYGDYARQDPYMTHRWCYRAEDVSEMMFDAGFAMVIRSAPAYHVYERDAAVIGVKAC